MKDNNELFPPDEMSLSTSIGSLFLAVIILIALVFYTSIYTSIAWNWTANMFPGVPHITIIQAMFIKFTLIFIKGDFGAGEKVKKSKILGAIVAVISVPPLFLLAMWIVKSLFM